MSKQNNDTAVMNDQSVVESNSAQSVGVVINNDLDTSGWLNTSGSHLTAEPQLSTVCSNVNSVVDLGHVAPGAQDSTPLNIVSDSGGLAATGDQGAGRPGPLMNTSGAERSSTSLCTGTESNTVNNEDHFTPRETQPYSYSGSLANVRSSAQDNVFQKQGSNIPVYTTGSALSDVDGFFSRD